MTRMDTEAIRGIFTTLPIDIVGAAVFATIITVDTMRAGASRAIALSLSLIISTVLFAALPGTFVVGGFVSSATTPVVAAGIFVALTILTAFIVHRATATVIDDSSRPLLALITGAATAIVVLSMWQLTPLTALWQFNAAIAAAFGASYRLFWLLLALVAFGFVKS